ncbi:hypothetical protein B0H63DRAFT_519397 [Podospora didyma]|uniref:Uncharacterized protein n=1 Tax=Podospora didyma TaxID=330526 RepID=A0AAE0NYS5_9PEZI|nr:hypothetical protein B0H63DRAFT_519397 [Podospora didyma]
MAAARGEKTVPPTGALGFDHAVTVVEKVIEDETWQFLRGDYNAKSIYFEALMPLVIFISTSKMENHISFSSQPLVALTSARASSVRGFQYSKSLMKHYGINHDRGCVDAYELLAPVIDTDRAMGWLMKLVADKGAKLVSEAVDSDLLDHED